MTAARTLVVALAAVVAAQAALGASDAPRPAAAYFVDSVTGDDAANGRSTRTAWRSLARASGAALRPGDSLLLRRGRRFSGTLTLSASGSRARQIVVGAYGRGALPVVSGGSSCVVVTGSYVVVREVHVDACTWAGIDLRGSHNRVERTVITHNAAGVHIRSSASANVVTKNRLDENNRMSVLTQTPQDDDSGAFGILLQGDRNDVSRNTISGSDAFSYDYVRDGAAVEVYGGRGNVVHHNLAIDNDAFTELGNTRSADNIFDYNVVRSKLARSIFLVTRGGVAATRAYNNTVFLTGERSQGFVCHAGCRSTVLVMRNNVISAKWKAGYADAPFDENHDLFFGATQFTLGPRSVVADPRFAAPGDGNLRLQAGSRAIDLGVDVQIRTDFDGRRVPLDGDGDGVARPDAGAYEFRR